MSRLNAALSSATQNAMHPEFGSKWGTEVPSAYPAVRGIQREADFFYIKLYVYLLFIFNPYIAHNYIIKTQFLSGTGRYCIAFYTSGTYKKNSL